MPARSLVQKSRFSTRFLSLVAVFSLSLGAVSSAQAAGLGELLFTSNLNEPLNATIELKELNGLGAEEILVSFASVENFDRAGMEYSAYLDDIKIEVLVLDNNNGRLFLTSEKPIVEPYLSFLLDMYWPSGRVQQEYTILLDLPALSAGGNTQTSISAPGASGRAIAPSSVRQTEEENVEYVVSNPDSELAIDYQQDEISTVTRVEQPGGNQYLIQAGDTLWEIAERMRPTTSVTVPQTMLSIQRANPQAFPSSNINLIRPLQVLNIPTENEIRSISPDDAVREVSNQNRQYQGLQVEPLTLNRVETGSSQPAPTDELALVTADDETQANAGNPGNASAAIASLENQLMVAEETIDRLRVENEELSSRLADLNNQIELLENIAVLKDQQLAELQGGATGESPVTAESAELARVEAVASEAAQQPATVTPPVTAPAPAPASLQEKAMDLLSRNGTLVAGGALVLALLLGLLVYRRARSRNEEDFDDEEMHYLDEEEDGEEGEDGEDEERGGGEDEDGNDRDADDGEGRTGAGTVAGAATFTSTVKTSRDDDLYSILDLNDVDETLSKTGTRDNPHERSPATESRAVTGGSEEPVDKEDGSVSVSTEDEVVLAVPAQEENVVPGLADDSSTEDGELEALEFTLDTLPEPVEESPAEDDNKEEFETITFPSAQDSDDAGVAGIEADDSSFPETDLQKDAEEKVEVVDFGNLTFGEESAEEDDEPDEDDGGKEATKIDLAVAYEAMGDIDGAREMLEEVLADGTDEDKKEAQKLLEEWKEL